MPSEQLLLIAAHDSSCDFRKEKKTGGGERKGEEKRGKEARVNILFPIISKGKMNL